MNINNFKCPICFEVYGDIYLPCTLQCGHSFCLEHIKHISNCPLCKTKIKNFAEIKQNCILRDISKDYVRIYKDKYKEEYEEIIKQEQDVLISEETKKRKEILDLIETNISSYKTKINEIHKIITQINDANNNLLNKMNNFFIYDGNNTNTNTNINQDCENYNN